MRIVICAGAPTSGKTTILKHVVRTLKKMNFKVAFLKVDVQYADEDIYFAENFNIPTMKVYSGELCPDHCNVMVLGDAINWAEREKANFLIVETAGLCLRCSPYIEGSPGIVALEATSGINFVRKIGPMLSLAEIAVVTKIDLISQAEREVFRSRIMETVPEITIIEADALHGIGIEKLVEKIILFPELTLPLFLKGNPPVGTCTICAGKKEIGWKNHFGVIRSLNNQNFYRGE